MYYIIQADWVIKYQIFVFVLIKLPVNLAIEEEITQMLFFLFILFLWNDRDYFYLYKQETTSYIFERETNMEKIYASIVLKIFIENRLYQI